MSKTKRPAQEPEKEKKAPQAEQTPADEAPEAANAETAEEKNAAGEAAAPETGDQAAKKEKEAPEDLPAQVEALKAQLAEANDRLLRTLAEYDNFRKRSQREKEALYSDSKSETAAKFCR